MGSGLFEHTEIENGTSGADPTRVLGTESSTRSEPYVRAAAITVAVATATSATTAAVERLLATKLWHRGNRAVLLGLHHR
jgi:hypothetical protein